VSTSESSDIKPDDLLIVKDGWWQPGSHWSRCGGSSFGISASHFITSHPLPGSTALYYGREAGAGDATDADRGESRAAKTDFLLSGV